MIFNSFVEWMEVEVLPLRAAYPTWERLDGASAGGNRTVVGRFRHAGRTWRVHADTHFAPLLRAHAAITQGRVMDPFVVEPTSGGMCLNLVIELCSKPKHLYVYGEA